MKILQGPYCRLIQTLMLALLFGTGLSLRAEEPINADLNAIEATQPIAASDLPAAAIFYSAQNPNLPATPGNFDFLPAWDLGGAYLLDDIDPVMRPMDAPAPPGDGGGGDGGTNLDSYSGWPFPTNGLWMQINGITNGIVSMALNNATDYVYEVWSATNLNQTNWNIETEVFSTNSVVMPFTVPVLDSTNSLFLYARDWTGIISDGNQITPEYWLYEYFATVDLSETNLDTVGNTLSNDYVNGLDPNVISFSVTATNRYFNTTNATVQISVAAGAPSYMTVLVDNTNFSTANWTSYNSNLAVNLGMEGWHTVWVGLRGLPASARETWQEIDLKLVLTPPVLTITNPATSTVMQPMIEVQGFCPQPLASLTFDVSNAAGLFTNQQALVLSQYIDTNSGRFTTNTFQAFDISVTNGANVVTFHATDQAGNATLTNFTYTLDYSGKTNPPGIQVYWPQNGDQVSGTVFTLRGSLDDFTASLTAQIIDSSDNTNTIQGLVERNGLFWVENAPLLVGTNYVTLTAMDAVGNIATTNLTINRVSAGVTINDFSGGLGGTLRNVIGGVSGTVAVSNCTLWVNGIQATQNGDGTWTAGSVPVGPGGTAVVEARAIPNSDNSGNGTGMEPPSDGTPGNPTAPDSVAAQIQIDQPPTCYIQTYHYVKGFTDQEIVVCDTGCPSENHNSIGLYHVDMAHMAGGTANYFNLGSDVYCDASGFYWNNQAYNWPCDQCSGAEVVTDNYDNEATDDYTNSVGPFNNQYPTTTTECSFSSHSSVPGNPPYACNTYIDDYNETVGTTMTLQTGGKGIPGLQNLFEIAVSATSYIQPYNPMGAAAVPPGEITDAGNTPDTNGLIVMMAAQNTAMNFTPQTPAQNYSFPIPTPNEYQPQIQANGITLDPIKTNATFCVGQQIQFNLAFSPTLRYSNEVCTWTLPDKYVNSITPNPPGSTIYTNNPSLLTVTNGPCVCWYVNGSGGTVSVQANMILTDGKTIPVSAVGKFAIYRPQITSVVPKTNITIVLQTNSAPNIYLGVGDPAGHEAMVWDLYVNVNTNFPGQGTYVQLIDRNFVWDEPYFSTSLTYNNTTSGAYQLDNAYPYDASGPFPVAGTVTNRDWNFGDGPDIFAPFYSFANCVDTFNTYVCFQPNGGIPVTIGRVGWGWGGSIVLTNGIWSLTISNITIPTLYPADDSFPQWSQVYTNKF